MALYHVSSITISKYLYSPPGRFFSLQLPPESVNMFLTAHMKSPALDGYQQRLWITVVFVDNSLHFAFTGGFL